MTTTTTYPAKPDTADRDALFEWGLAVAKVVVETVSGYIGSDFETPDLSPIETRSLDGFIPHTDGGWDAVSSFTFYSETSHSTEHMKPFIESDYEDMVRDFRRAYDLDDEADVTEHDEWEDFSSNWEQSTESWWCMKTRALAYRPDGVHHRRNVTGKDELLFCIGFNDDFGYGRDSVGNWARGVGTHWLWEATEAIDELTPERCDEIISAMKKVWDEA